MKTSEAVIDSFQTQTNIHLHAATDCQNQGKEEEALAHLQEACELSGENPEIVRSLGRHLLRLGRYGQARKRFEQLARILPNDPSAHLGVALACQKCGPPEQFEQALANTLSLDPQNTQALKLEADLHFSRGELKAALDGYLKILPQNPDDLDVLRALAATLLRGGEKRIASDVYQKILRICPSDSLARQNLSLLTGEANNKPSRDNGNRSAAIQNGTPTVPSAESTALWSQTPPELGDNRAFPEISPCSSLQPALSFMAGLGLYREGSREAAIDESWKVVRTLSKVENSEVASMIGQPVLRITSALLMECGRFEEVVALSEAGLGRFCEVAPSVDYLLALALTKLQRPAEAIVRLRRLMSRLNQSGSFESGIQSQITANQVEHLLASNEACVHDFASAEKTFRCIAQRDPTSLPARRGLARVAAAKGDMDQAARLLGETLEANPWDITTWRTGLNIAESPGGTLADDADLPPVPVQEISPQDWEDLCFGAVAELLQEGRNADALKLIETNFDKEHAAYRAVQLLISYKRGSEDFNKQLFRVQATSDHQTRAIDGALRKLRRSGSAPVIDAILRGLSAREADPRSSVPESAEPSKVGVGRPQGISSEFLRSRIIHDDIAPDIQEFFRKSGNTERAPKIGTKDALAAGIARLVNRHFDFKANALNARAKRDLKREGISRLGRVFSDAEVGEIVGYFRALPVYSSHVWAQSDGVPRYLHQDAKQHRFGSYKQLEILNAPYLLEAALSPKILNIAEEYLGCAPLLFSINAWWNFGGFHKSVGLTQDFHRDLDDYKFLSFFIFLTDVGENGGQHTFIRGTHTKEALFDHVRDRALVESVFSDGDYGKPNFAANAERLVGLMEDFRGEAGQGFIADTYGLHRGVPSERDRFVYWCRYGLHKNYAYEYDQTCRIPTSQLNRKFILSDKTRFMTSLILDDQK